MNYPIRKLSETKIRAIRKLNQRIRSGDINLEKVDCPICSSKRCKPLFKNDRFGLLVNVVMCNTCGLVYENPVFDDNSLKKFYESVEYREIYGGTEVSDYERRYHYDPENTTSQKEYAVNESFYDFIKESKLEFKTVLEVGAAGGWNAIPFLQNNYSYSGIEPSHKLVDIAQKKGIQVKQGFVQDIKHSYDLIFLRHVLEHFKDPKKEIELLSQYTTNLAIEVPGFIHKVPSIQNAHLVYFSINTLQQLFADTGFKLIKLNAFEKNGFIMAIFSKSTDSVFSYSYMMEKIRILRIWYRFVCRLWIKQIIKR